MWMVRAVTPGWSFCAPDADVATATSATTATKTRNAIFNRIAIALLLVPIVRSRTLVRRLSRLGCRDSSPAGSPGGQRPDAAVQQARDTGRQQQHDDDHDDA